MTAHDLPKRYKTIYEDIHVIKRQHTDNENLVTHEH